MIPDSIQTIFPLTTGHFFPSHFAEYAKKNATNIRHSTLLNTLSVFIKVPLREKGSLLPV